MESERVTIGQSFNTKMSVLDIHILVVDDDATSLAIVSAMLKTWRYGVVTVRNPMDALATLRMQKFDLVVTDLHMPVMNGFELQKQVEEEFNLPVIMMSADDKESVILKSLEAGAAFFIVKPVSPDDLKNVWQYAVAAKKGKSVTIEEIRSIPGKSSGEKISLEEIHSSSSSVNEEKHGKKNSKRKAPKREKDDGEEDNPAAMKRTKVVWTNSLHNRFLQAIRHIGLEKAVPKRILEFMNVPGLTRENVASHLQKYRIFLKRVADKVASTPKCLSDRTLRSSFASGLPSQIFKNAQQDHTKFPDQQQQMRTSIFQLGLGGKTLSTLNSPNLGPIHFPNRPAASSSCSPAMTQIGYGQSFNNPPKIPSHFPNQFHSLRNQANLQQPMIGNINLFYQPNRQAAFTLGSNFSSQGGNMTYGLMNATNGRMNNANSVQIYPKQTQSRPDLITTTSPLNMGSLNSSPALNSSYAGIQMTSEGELVGYGRIGFNGGRALNEVNNGLGLLNNGHNDNMISTVEPMGNGNFGYMAQGGSFSAGFESGNQLSSILNTINQQENASVLPVNEGEIDYSYDDMLNSISKLQQLDEDDLTDLFLEQINNQPPSQQQGVEEITSDFSNISSGHEAEVNPLVDDFQNPDFSGPFWNEQSFDQHQGGEKMMGFDGSVFKLGEHRACSNQYSNQQESSGGMVDSNELSGMYQVENTPSESHPFLCQEWDDEFVDSLFDIGQHI